MGQQAVARARIVQVLDGLVVTEADGFVAAIALHGLPVQPATANPWDAWPVWDFSEVTGFACNVLTSHWGVFVVLPAGDRAGLIEAGDLVAEVVASELANELPAQIERVEPLQLTFDEGGVKPVVRIALIL
jgi:hypothetical protein